MLVLRPAILTDLFALGASYRGPGARGLGFIPISRVNPILPIATGRNSLVGLLIPAELGAELQQVGKKNCRKWAKADDGRFIRTVAVPSQTNLYL
jgi:hypothetical protein